MTGAGTDGAGTGKAATKGMMQAAHLAPNSCLIGPSKPPLWMDCRPSVEQMKMGWPGVDAANAAKGIRVPMKMAKTAARKASERVKDQSSAWHRFTQPV
jgi:hypothetical protein